MGMAAATGTTAAAAVEGAGEASTTGRPGCPRPKASRRRGCRPGRRPAGRTRIARARARAGGGAGIGHARATAGAGVVVTRVKYECCIWQSVDGDTLQTGKDQAGGFLMSILANNN